MFNLRFLPSFSTIFVLLVLGYFISSVWSMYQLFIPPTCPNVRQCIKPLLQDDPKMQFLAFSSIKSNPKHSSDVSLLLKKDNFDFHEAINDVIDVTIPTKVRSNGTMFFHLYLTSQKVDSKNWQSVVDSSFTISVSTALTKYREPKAKAFNLLHNGGTENENNSKSKQSNSQKWVRPTTHFVSKIVYNVMTDPVVLPADAIPYEIGRNLRLTQKGKYLPVLHIDQLSLRFNDLEEITTESTNMTLNLQYLPISYGKLRMWIQFEGAIFSMLDLGFTEKDIDEVKGIFSDSNLYFLSVTFTVAIFHLIFDFLAFKNDISFWKGLDNMQGISTSTIAWRCFAQIIIFLFLVEEKTSLLVLIPAGLGIVIETWKVTKAFHIERDGFRLRIRTIVTKEENVTKDLDSQGLRYLSYIMIPLCLAGAVYSLFYTPHKSWYSWLINSLVSGVYAFGFLFMMPQLFINYKLKSVAHLPWKSFMYKAFNTFIDDLFAFIITMPTAHRVACLRDDVIFVIYLYQRWLYPVDKKRINEFGQSGDGEVKQKKE